MLSNQTLKLVISRGAPRIILCTRIFIINDNINVEIPDSLTRDLKGRTSYNIIYADSCVNILIVT